LRGEIGELVKPLLEIERLVDIDIVNVTHGAVALVRERLRQGNDFVRQLLVQAVRLVRFRGQRGEQGGDGRSGPGGVSNVGLEQQAFGGKRVDGGGGIAAIAVAGETVGTQGVNHDQQDMRHRDPAVSGGGGGPPGLARGRLRPAGQGDGEYRQQNQGQQCRGTPGPGQETERFPPEQLAQRKQDGEKQQEQRG